MASKLADGILLYLRPIEELKKTTAELRQATKGRGFEIACSFICAVSNKEPEKARERGRNNPCFLYCSWKVLQRFIAENGFKIEVEQITAEYKKAGADCAAKFVSDKMLRSLVICGTSRECRKSLSKFVSAGITLPIMQFNPVGDSESSFKGDAINFLECAR